MRANVAERLLAAVLVLGGCDDASAPPPGAEAPPPEVAPIALRRLNRAEYDNTVRDLLGTQRHPAADFPADERGHGFDVIASLLDVSPEHMALYERAAWQLADEALEDEAQRARLVPCHASADAACAAEVIDAFAPRAFRRPLEVAERERLLGLYARLRTDGDDFDAALSGVLASILASPHFLFRIERDPDPEGAQAHPVSAFELASRLSYFLWSSMPDDELYSAAAEGRLQSDAEIEAEVERMLDDPRARALVDDFAGQWLHFRALDDVFKDAARFPRFDDELRNSMKRELEHAFSALVAEDRDVRDLLLATTTTIDRDLAAVYGIATAPYEGTREIDLSALPRRGILTSPGLMTVLARPFRTAPVKRGAWVLGQLLCEPPPPPPAGVEGFVGDEDAASVRERLESHREDPSCAGCHDRIDPIGLAFEHYDAIGAWRAEDAGLPVDATGVLPDGTSIDGAVELAAVLAEDPAFLDCVVRQTLTYALGRGLVATDEPHVQSIAQELSARGGSARSLFVLVALSPPFRFRAPREAA